MADDLELSELDNFTGTEQYHKISPMFKTPVTDGVVYIMENGYSWFVTDMLAVIETKLRDKSDFYAITLKVKDSTAKATITDGNKHTLYTQKYSYTNAKRDLTLYWESGVLLLSREH